MAKPRWTVSTLIVEKADNDDIRLLLQKYGTGKNICLFQGDRNRKIGKIDNFKAFLKFLLGGKKGFNRGEKFRILIYGDKKERLLLTLNDADKGVFRFLLEHHKYLGANKNIARILGDYDKDFAQFVGFNEFIKVLDNISKDNRIVEGEEFRLKIKLFRQTDIIAKS